MDLQLLLKKSEEYESEEGRADVYPMVKHWIETHEGSDVDMIRAVATLLFVWNAGYYVRAGRGFPSAIQSLDKLFRNRLFRELLPTMMGFRISTADLDSLRDKIVRLYDCVDAHEGLGVAGSSKVLHLLQSELFIMWDDKICTYYHKGHRKRGMRHQRGGGNCYYEFLSEMQTHAQEMLKAVEERAVLEQIEKICGYPKTLTKALDEANYLIHTKKKT
jgi:hypothetical protein